MAEVILPGTYITVRDEALISAGRVVTGNIGIVGTASKGPLNEVKILGSFTEAKEMFGESDAWIDGNSNELTMIRALEQVYNNGGRTVYAVRTASGTATNAAYQTVDDLAANLTRLEAVTPGTWGNQIKIEIIPAEQPALVTEELAGDATSLNRSNVVASSGLNSISLRQQSTGQILRYNLVYNAAPDNAQPQVGIDTTTGALTFTTLVGFAPIAADTIIASYEVPVANARKVTLAYQTQKETYTVADASHLAEQVNQDSNLVGTDPSDETGFYNQLPAVTALEVLFGTGLDGHSAGSNGADADATAYQTSLAFLENDLVNIVSLAGQDVSNNLMVNNLMAHLNTTAENKRERIGLMGSSSSTDPNTIAGHNLNSERLIFVGPGIKVGPKEVLTGAYTAAAVAGLISSLQVQASPTNKVLTIPGLSVEFSSSQLEKLVLNRVLAVEKREGFRVVKGITTATNSAWHQITTRRIVDFAIYGVRSACNPYIGKLNNERVRGAMKATLDAFLTRMVNNEALVSYELSVSATRAQEIAGEAIVTMTVRPTFSIDFIKVTMYLE
ncbi:MAG: phage tail sheath C-terminal domain-containing protein [Bacteroidota bacterium]